MHRAGITLAGAFFMADQRGSTPQSIQWFTGLHSSTTQPVIEILTKTASGYP